MGDIRVIVGVWVKREIAKIYAEVNIELSGKTTIQTNFDHVMQCTPLCMTYLMSSILSLK